MEETSAILIVAAFFGGGSWSSLGLRTVGKHLFVAILIPRARTKKQLINIFKPINVSATQYGGPMVAVPDRQKQCCGTGTGTIAIVTF
jgi:hypothetical protein